jgi:hypothetical protein
LGGTSRACTVAQVVEDCSEVSASSGVPLRKIPTPRGTILPPQASHGYKLTGRQLSAQHLQRGQQLQRCKPQRESLRLELTGAPQTYCLPRLNLVSKFPPLYCLVQEGDELVCLGGTSKARTVAKVVDDGDGSFVIEGTVNTACRCLTPPQAHCTPRLPTQSILFCVLTRAQRNARTLQPAALAFVPYGFVLGRVRVPTTSPIATNPYHVYS